jgi:fatty-acyl-CoA synthase
MCFICFFEMIKVNVNPGYRAKELEYCLNLVQCNTLICTQKFRTSDYCQILDSISPNILINTNGVEVQCEK